MAIDMITTTLGRQAILDAVAQVTTITVQNVILCSTDESVDEDTQSVNNVVATLSASGEVDTQGGDPILRVSAIDDSAAAYDVRTVVLQLDDNTYLMVYSEAAVIVSKGAGSSLALSLNLAIDDDTATTVVLGDTNHLQPSATETREGVAEIATQAESDAGTDDVRMVTPAKLDGTLHGDYRSELIREIGARIDRANLFNVLNSSSTPTIGIVGFAERPGTGQMALVDGTDFFFSNDYGATWSTAAGGLAQYNDVCYCRGLDMFCAVGNNDGIVTTPGGGSFGTLTVRTGPGLSQDLRKVDAPPSESYFAAVSDGSPQGGIATSLDGITWVMNVALGSNDLLAVLANDDRVYCGRSVTASSVTVYSIIAPSVGSGPAEIAAVDLNLGSGPIRQFYSMPGGVIGAITTENRSSEGYYGFHESRDQGVSFQRIGELNVDTGASPSQTGVAVTRNGMWTAITGSATSPRWWGIAPLRADYDAASDPLADPDVGPMPLPVDDVEIILHDRHTRRFCWRTTGGDTFVNQLSFT